MENTRQIFYFRSGTGQRIIAEPRWHNQIFSEKFCPKHFQTDVSIETRHKKYQIPRDLNPGLNDSRGDYYDLVLHNFGNPAAPSANKYALYVLSYNERLE